MASSYPPHGLLIPSSWPPPDLLTAFWSPPTEMTRRFERMHAGESQLEVDRRLFRKQLSRLEDDIASVQVRSHQIASGCFWLLLVASGCFWLLRMASDSSRFLPITPDSFRLRIRLRQLPPTAPPPFGLPLRRRSATATAPSGGSVIDCLSSPSSATPTRARAPCSTSSSTPKRSDCFRLLLIASDCL